jgi:hypothetical protein
MANRCRRTGRYNRAYFRYKYATPVAAGLLILIPGNNKPKLKALAKKILKILVLIRKTA